MEKRLQLQALLEAILGTRNVYFQAPSNVTMNYPCIVYQLDDEDTVHASNASYLRNTRYQVTVIDRNPDSAIPKKIADLPLCGFSRRFVADGLNHTAYNLYF